ncbi:hypothetical protein [Noviherbaspirillum massiliense]|uniref:hypothetical protein n=1 Tax=Noviherbaspirillum massiliense TaxID=1465823 RepID=UPI0003016A69|nr:hypothetical protein [Noviherbaspirillum massiliense]
MKLIGTIILALGLGLGIYAFTMKTGLELPSKNLGFGISTPAVSIADPDLLAKRQNYLIYAGLLSVAGAVLLGFGATGKRRRK